MVSDLYFVFVIYQVLTAKERFNEKERVIENEKVRQTFRLEKSELRWRNVMRLQTS